LFVVFFPFVQQRQFFRFPWFCEQKEVGFVQAKLRFEYSALRPLDCVVQISFPFFEMEKALKLVVFGTANSGKTCLIQVIFFL
jgi:hypothetical protein